MRKNDNIKLFISLYDLQKKGGSNMGKSLKGKELGKGISQRKNGLYQARFTNRFGKRQTIYGKTYKEITQKLREAEYEDSKELNPASSDITLDQWFDIWMETYKKNCKDNTRFQYTVVYKKLKRDLGWRKLNQLNLVLLQDVFNKFETDATRKTTKTLLISILDKAVESDLIMKHYARKINTKVTKEPKQERRVLSEEETELFLEFARGSVYENLYIVALETGMRISELIGLKYQDVDFEKKIISVHTSLCYYKDPVTNKKELHYHKGKTENSTRLIPLTNNCTAALKNQYSRNMTKCQIYGELPAEHKGLIFTTRNNKPIKSTCVYQAMQTIIDKINKCYPEKNWSYFGPHTFRHSFATKAIEKGVRPKTLQKILGHADIETTMNLYCHVTEDALFDEMKKFETEDSL